MALSKHRSNSSTEIGYNEDLITYIFLRLPVKSVLKCKCVCKHWQSIASNPQFCGQHAALHGRNPSPSGLLFERSFDNSSDFEFCSLTGGNNNNITRIVSFDYLNAPGTLSLLSSCNGLLLFQSSNFPDHPKFYVCNPTTKKFSTLALPNYLTTDRNVDANLAFDPRVSPHYKVVFLRKGFKYRWYGITIYSSETKTCQKLIDMFASNGLELVGRTGVFCNGKIHWLVKDFEKSLYFDVEKGCLNEFPLAPWYSLCKRIHCFGESGHLQAILCGRGGADVYELKEDYSGWVVKYQIKVPLDNFLLCYFCKEQDEGSILLQLAGSGEIVAYNLKEKTRNKICDLNPLCKDRERHYRFNPLYEDYRWCSGSYQWIETLSCI